MMDKQPVLVWGSGRLAHSVTACLLRCGHSVTLRTDKPEEAIGAIARHLDLGARELPVSTEPGQLSIFRESGESYTPFILAVLITPDQLREKKSALVAVEPLVAPDGIIAINLESIRLEELQGIARAPEQLAGVNWVEPAHTTFFLEIISNKDTASSTVAALQNWGLQWGKDPYVVTSGFSVKARIHAALTREALFLVRNGYADFEDIDRNCRNDAGYYLPFTGNLRYMDLMGTLAYGVVMKDLNPTLSKADELDHATASLVENHPEGMRSGKGFFEYSEAEIDEWERKMETFSYQIHHLMKKYPFDYNT